jgi:AAT family amino acid transporter
MAGFPYLTVLALAILALIFALLMVSPQTRMQFLSMAALTAFIALCSALARRARGG